MWYKVEIICKKKVEKTNCIVVNFFIWIIIKNYLCNIKSEKKLVCFEADYFLEKWK
jgi:hypothetical protein